MQSQRYYLPMLNVVHKAGNRGLNRFNKHTQKVKALSSLMEFYGGIP